MEKEYLDEYRKKMFSLTEEERKLRDEYLLKMYNGIIQGPVVDDIYTNRKWITRYDYDNGHKLNLKDTIYNMYIKETNDILDDIAVFEYATKTTYTHRQLRAMIDEASKGLTALGIGPNSKVGVMLNGSIEEAVLFFALCKVGATLKYIDYMKSVPSMIDNANEVNLDMLIMDEIFLPLNQVLNPKGKNVIVANSNKEYEGNIINSKELGEIGKNEPNFVAPYEENKVVLMINSSGTTGHPKPINHTDYSVNAAVEKMLYSEFPYKRGNAVIKMIPSQIGLGLITSLYTGLVSGSAVILIGGTDKQKLIDDVSEFVSNFEQYKKLLNLPEDSKIVYPTACAFARELVMDPRVTDLSVMGGILAAGSKMDKEELDELNEVLKKKDGMVPVTNAYGQNEQAGAQALNTPSYNKNGTAGYPTYETDILVINKSTKEILEPVTSDDTKEDIENKTGLIIERSNSKFHSYEGMPEKTKETEIVMPDGTVWYNTADLGYMDSDAYLHVMGREGRFIVCEDFKFNLDDVESKIRSLNMVKDCATISTSIGGSVEKFAAYIQLESGDLKDVEEAIKHNPSLSIYEIPTEIFIVEKIPYKGNGKIDYDVLKKYYDNQNVMSK